jgi:drug/metabolite transporter (DMT)-like permease
VRLAILTALALAGFAANSLLCRMALGGRHIDAATFTLIRLASGAATLALLAARVPRESRWCGTWTGAAALFVYAAAFSFAYLRLGAGIGALILFGSVQVTMIAWGLRRGERPHIVEWFGLLVAAAGLVALTAPGLAAPDPVGAGLMAAAGIAWGVYSLKGRAAGHPVAATADHFLRALLVAALLSAFLVVDVRGNLRGAALAVISGAVTSGVAYALWYAALRHLTATRAALLQLAVPALAAAGGVLLLGEALTARLALAGGVILGGVALAQLRPRPATMPRP